MNAIPITIEFTMPSEHFRQYGALFEYFITRNNGDHFDIFDLDVKLKQFVNADGWIVKTQINELKILWMQQLMISFTKHLEHYLHSMVNRD